jgi:hypothetical protein
MLPPSLGMKMEAAYCYQYSKLHSVTCHKTTLFTTLRKSEVHVYSRLIFMKSPLFGQQTCADVMRVTKWYVHRSLSLYNHRGGTASIRCHSFMYMYQLCINCTHVSCRTLKSGFTDRNLKNQCCSHCCNLYLYGQLVRCTEGHYKKNDTDFTEIMQHWEMTQESNIASHSGISSH